MLRVPLGPLARAAHAPSAAILVILMLVAMGPSLRRDVWMTTFAAVCVFSGTCSGFLMNEIRDAAIDSRIKPYRPLPSGALAASTARVWATGTYVVAVIAAIGATLRGAAGLLLIAFVLIGIFYTPIKYSLGVIKNVYVALCFSLPIAFAVEQRGSFDRWELIGALFFFLIYRELAMDIHDAAGDRGAGIQSLPLVLPTRAVEFILWAAWCVAMVLPAVAPLEVWKRFVWLAILTLSLLAFVWGLTPLRREPWRRLTLLMWIPMAGMAVLFV